MKYYIKLYDLGEDCKPAVLRVWNNEGVKMVWCISEPNTANNVERILNHLGVPKEE